MGLERQTKNKLTMFNILRFKQLLLTTALLIASVPSFAYDFEVDGIYYNILSDSTVEITFKEDKIGSASYSGSVTILSSVTFESKIYDVTSIGRYAFEASSDLTSINLSDGVTSIGDYAFKGCSGLTSINIPDGVTSIGNYAFQNCSGLISINIGCGVTSIGGSAFRDCSKIKEIFCESENPPTCKTTTFEGVPKIYSKVYVPEVSVEKYQEATGWNEFSNLIGMDMGNPNASETCEAPTIIFDNNERKLKFSCGTEGATFVCSIKSVDIFSNIQTESEIPLAGTYTITVYATKEDMKKSKDVTATLVWVSAAIESDGILTAKADRGVIVSSNANQINISGTVNGETIEIYNVGGSKLKSVNATGDNTTINGLQSGSVYIIKIGGTKVKVAM